MITCNELFSGIGSQRLSLRNIGIPHKIIGISEIDKFAIKSYEAIHGSTYNYGDISKIDKLNYADLWTYSFPCFIAGTLVMTNTGLKSIEDITIEDKVLTHNNNFQPVLKTMVNRTTQLYKIDTMPSESIYTTEEHPFYIRKRSRKYSSELKKQIRVFSEPLWVKAKDLDKNCYIGIAINQKSKVPDWNGGRKDRYSNILKDKFDENEFWWIIGRYIGDGWHRNQGGIIICCAKNELEEIIPKLEKLQFNHSIVNEKTVYKIHLAFKEIGDYCEQFGRGAENKKLTSDIFDLPINFLKSFLEGYWSADGCKQKNYYCATSVSKELIHGLGQCIAKAYNRPFSIYYTKRKPTCIIEGRVVNQKDTYEIKYKLETNIQDKAFYENGYIWAPINSIEMENKECNVYNIEVENDNSYTVNNIIVHNCQDISLSGKQEGLGKGTRSGLLYEVQRLLNISRKYNELPKYLMLENVKNLVGNKFKKDFENWLEYLDDLGYNNYWQVLNAKDYGIPQNRERIFVISINKNIDIHGFNFPKPILNNLRLKDFLEEEVEEKFYLSFDKIQEFTEDFLPIETTGCKISHQGKIIGSTVDICSTLMARDYKGFGDQRMTGIVEVKHENIEPFNTNFRIRRITPREHWRLMGFSDKEFDKAKEVCSNTQLYKQSGNSIVVNVLEAIFRNLFELK